jgi:hypothetical protein
MKGPKFASKATIGELFGQFPIAPPENAEHKGALPRTRRHTGIKRHQE